MKRWLLAVPLLLLGGPLVPVQADIGGPRPRPGPVVPRQVPLVVEVDLRATEAVLEVPMGLLVAPGGGFGAAPGARSDAGPWRLPSIVAGLALALALGSGGYYLVQRRAGRTIAVLIGVSVLTLSGTALWADLAPRPVARPSIVLPANIRLPSRVRFLPARHGAAIRLIVPKGMVGPGAKVRAGKAGGFGGEEE